MLLYELPPEILAKILDVHASDARIKNLVKHRIVCARLNSFILDYVLDAAVTRRIPELSTRTYAFKQLLRHHAADVLTRMLLLLDFGPNSFPDFLNGVVDKMMSDTSDLNSEQEHELREHYTEHICCAANALAPDVLQSHISCIYSGLVQTSTTEPLQYSWRAAGAAIGKKECVLQDNPTIKMLFSETSGYPDALSAAVAAGQKDVVDAIMKYIVQTAKGPHMTGVGTWDEMRIAATGIYEALLVGVRLHHDDITGKLVEALAKNKELGRSVNPKLRRTFYEFCITYDNFEFYTQAWRYKATRDWEVVRTLTMAVPEQDEDGVQYLLRRCSRWMLRRLIETKQFDPNYVGKKETQIFLALSVRRQSLLKVLIQAGADVDGLPRVGGGSAVYRAKQNDWSRDARFSKFEYGARSIAPPKRV